MRRPAESSTAFATPDPAGFFTRLRHLRHPKVTDNSAVVLAAADREVSLASVHVLVGEWLVRSTGLDETAIDVANARFRDVLPEILGNPEAALDAAVARMPGNVRFGYIGAPAMLVLAMLLWWKRPRSVHLVRTRR